MRSKKRDLFLALTIVLSVFFFSGEACFDIGTPTEPDEPSADFSCSNLRISPDPAYVGRNDAIRFTWDRGIAPKRTCRRVMEIGGYLDRSSFATYGSENDVYTSELAESISRVVGYGTFTCYVYYEDNNGNFSSKASRTVTIRP